MKYVRSAARAIEISRGGRGGMETHTQRLVVSAQKVALSAASTRKRDRIKITVDFSEKRNTALYFHEFRFFF